MRTTLLATAAGVLIAACAAPTPTDPEAEVRRWWSHLEVLASDELRGRDTGSLEHRRAQEYVVEHLERNGLEPAGEQGFFQSVPIRSYRLRTDLSAAAVTRDGRTEPLRWLQHITVRAALGLPEQLSGRLVFAGSDNAAGVDVTGAIVVRLEPVRLVDGPPVPSPPAGAAAVVAIDSAVGPEPRRWPAQYAVSMALADAGTPTVNGVPTFRFNPARADTLLAGSGHTY